jgi:hypothetical protein
MGYKTFEYYEKQEDGTFIVTTEEKWVDEPTPEEIIAEKEAELLKIYAEIQALKQN